MGIYTHVQTRQVTAIISALSEFNQEAAILTGTDTILADAFGVEMR